MERLTNRIREFDGVLVDYMGDGIIAMWNAPADQPEHAVLACRAALAMLAELPRLSADWQEMIGGPLSIGIGLNTGPDHDAATPAASTSSSTARSATRSTWPAVSRGRPSSSTSRP